MNSILLLCLALVLSGYCRAAIVFPKSPDGGREIVVTNVGPALVHDPHFFDGLADIIIVSCNGRENVADMRVGCLFH